MKGQSAIEYLTTYGWMLLALAISSGVIYSQIPSNCQKVGADSITSDLKIENYGMSESNLSIIIRNTASDTVRLENVSIGRVEKTVSTMLGSSETIKLSFGDFKRSNSCNNLQVETIYDKGGLKELNYTSNINGKFTPGMALVTPTISSVQQ